MLLGRTELNMLPFVENRGPCQPRNGGVTLYAVMFVLKRKAFRHDAEAAPQKFCHEGRSNTTSAERVCTILFK